MAASSRVQFGSEWTTSILNSFGIHSTVCDEFNNSWKRKHDRDSAHKISLKYKNSNWWQGMTSKQSNVHLIHAMGAIHQSQMFYVMSWSDSAESIWDTCRYKILCSNSSIVELHHNASLLQVISEKINQITIRTVDQGDGQSSEWVVQRCGRVTTYIFGDILRQKAAYAPLIARILYSKPRRT